MAETAGEKARLRRELLARRRRVVPEVAAAAGREMAAHAAAAPEFAAARCIALYAALSDEIATAPLFEAARRRGKHVLFPRMVATGRRLEFAPAARFEDLRPGPWGVPEPAPEAPAEPLGVDALVFVPGVAFDRVGNRLGRGQGFYDRTFPPGGPGQPLLFGLAFHFQLLEAVPQAQDDRPMDAVVTERGIHRMARRR